MKPWRHDTPASVVHDGKAACVVDLGLVDYAAVRALQLALVEKRRSGQPVDDVFLVTEHPRTFTLGRRGGRRHLMVSEEFLRERQIPLLHIERGGDITYHGPGQLVVYPIVHLRQAGLGVAEYVCCLEEIMLRLAAESGVVAGRDPRNHGVWAGGKKLGSVGIAIRHGITFHGLALNVSLDLAPFSWVNPCGLAGVQMTSLSRECGRQVEVGALKKDLLGQLTRIFGRPFIPLSKENLHVIVHKPEPFGQTQMAEAQSADRTGI
ncbi:MAG: lipoyl(octanoyl) transferase LipB [Desulforhopalus sp.]|nr:lipoyl(octanoyl) transferase LipB [Desulforhopalus sp.]